MSYTVPKLEDLSADALRKAAADLTAACERESKGVGNDAELKAFRDRWIARKNGILTQVNEVWLKAAPKEAKRDVGELVNSLRQKVEERIESARERLTAAGTNSREATDIDVTLPGIRRPIGV